MGRAEDAYNRIQAEHARIEQENFIREAQRLFDQIDSVLASLPRLAERAGFADVRPVHAVYDEAGNRTWLVGWRVATYDPDSASGCEAYVLASTGDLYMSNIHYNDPRGRNDCLNRHSHQYNRNERGVATGTTPSIFQGQKLRFSPPNSTPSPD